MLLGGTLFSLQTHILPSYINLKDFVLENGKRCRVSKQHIHDLLPIPFLTQSRGILKNCMPHQFRNGMRFLRHGSCFH